MGCFSNFEGWWILALFFLFILFQECIDEICIQDWIPFLILILIISACDDLGCD